ncbi:hypothetical protein KTH44_15955 [Acinetobacter bereziniae]|uniref:hypothetical protein n=1 Tax=Acinetobacter bereziniae TaxID=106648 RepID=UPI0021CD5299|nr:hypothetical protein [Acinetobacter bereziniae]MCU4320611.1 hypothetical protein [Acinetobacter bereziniae]
MYPAISIAEKSYSLESLLVENVLTIAKIKKQYYEQQLTNILTTIIQGEVNPLHLTCEERYAIYLCYLNLTRDKNELDHKINIDDYLSTDLDTFNKDRIYDEQEDISIRHLYGAEAHALEIGCENTEDWILGAMAITIGCKELPPIDTATSVEFSGKMIASRINDLRKIDVDNFNRIMTVYMSLQRKQDHLVSIAFDDGIVLEKMELRGADDAPVRFRSATAFSGYAKIILSLAYGKDTGI